MIRSDCYTGIPWHIETGVGWWSTIYSIEMGSKLTITRNLLPFVVAPVTSCGKYTNMLAINSIYTRGNLKMQIQKEREHSLSGSQNHLSLPLSQSSLPLLRIILPSRTLRSNILRRLTHTTANANALLQVVPINKRRGGFGFA